jgi:hypothetical protein
LNGVRFSGDRILVQGAKDRKRQQDTPAFGGL